MDAGEIPLVLVPGLMAAGALIGAGFTVRSWHRTRAVLRDGQRVPARCVRISTRVSGDGENGTSSRQRYVLEYAVPAGATHRIDEGTLPSTTCEGDMVTVAYDTRRPGQGVVVPPDGGTGGVGAAVLVAFLLVFAVGALVFAHSAAGSFDDGDMNAPFGDSGISVLAPGTA
ncbi:DUF3592 domain-containing protein [Streptomyces sp. NPDC088354]|uniref:DUF3592 domain-containing protein n=1 Tax=Streptomyces sp. NPDC088354 TaxID=3365856 RepID=UPI003802548E